jgi:hypothetical protein
MKVFRYTALTPPHITLIPRRNQQCEAVVAAPSRDAAVQLFRAVGIDCSLHSLRSYGGETGNVDSIAVAEASPGTVYVRPLDSHDRETFVPVPLWAPARRVDFDAVDRGHAEGLRLVREETFPHIDGSGDLTHRANADAAPVDLVTSALGKLTRSEYDALRAHILQNPTASQSQRKP